jgi:hypothetical protein
MQITTIGLDLAKHVFQIHAVDAEGRIVVRKALRRAQMIPFSRSFRVASLALKPAAPLIIGLAR